jgi:LacI family transcriptional regulator
VARVLTRARVPYQAAKTLLDLRSPPTAIFAASDHMATGATHAVRARGLRRPADVALVGFDDVPIVELANPTLTSVNQPIAKMGATVLK